MVFFNMMMVVNTDLSTKKFVEISEEMEELGKEIGCIIKVQREDIFDKMHRL